MIPVWVFALPLLVSFALAARCPVASSTICYGKGMVPVNMIIIELFCLKVSDLLCLCVPEIQLWGALEFHSKLSLKSDFPNFYTSSVVLPSIIIKRLLTQLKSSIFRAIISLSICPSLSIYLSIYYMA